MLYTKWSVLKALSYYMVTQCLELLIQPVSVHLSETHSTAILQQIWGNGGNRTKVKIEKNMDKKTKISILQYPRSQGEDEDSKKISKQAIV